MKSGKKIWGLFGCALVVLVIFIVVMRGRPEPVYAGRTLSSWFHEAEMTPIVTTGAPSTIAICALGTNAVLFLAVRVRQPDSIWYNFYRRHYPSRSARLRRWLPEPPPPNGRQENAARLLYEMGPSARAATPDLIAAYDLAYLTSQNRSTRSSVDWTREFTNASTRVPPTAMRTQETRLRSYILLALAQCGDGNLETIPLLFTATRDPDTTLRGQAEYLLEYGTNLPASIVMAEPVELLALRDANPEVRSLAAKTLARLPPGRPEIVPPLLQATGDADDYVRRSAWVALQKARPDLASVLPAVGRILNDTNSYERSLALRVVSKSVGITNVVPTLNQLLSHTNSEVRLSAARTLSAYGGGAQVAIPRLRQLTNAAFEPDESVRAAAVETLARIAP